MTDRPNLLNALRMAFEFLTVLPVPRKDEWNDRDFGWSAVFFPLAGCIIGLGAGLAFRLFSAIFVKPITAMLTLIIWIMLSGGLHWDGLADCFDGFGCAASPERRLEIMKDSRLGTYGALGLICSLGLKWLCLQSYNGSEPLLFFALTGASVRWAMLLLLSMPLANPNGMAAMLKAHCPRRILLYAAPLPILLSLLHGRFGLLYPLLNLGLVWLLSLIAKKKIGGISGDVLGFSIELGEILLLLAAQVIP